MLPEEKIRQQLLLKMKRELGYPSSLLVVEKKLSEFPHLKGVVGVPNRRVDLCVYIKKEEALEPLLIVECKACKVDAKAASQLIGYNDFIGALFIGLAGSGGFFLGRYDTPEKGVAWSPQLPKYESLLAWEKSFKSNQGKLNATQENCPKTSL